MEQTSSSKLEEKLRGQQIEDASTKATSSAQAFQAFRALLLDSTSYNLISTRTPSVDAEAVKVEEK